jgi:hypothetical protein
MHDSPPPTKETRVGTPLRSSIAGLRGKWVGRTPVRSGARNAQPKAATPSPHPEPGRGPDTQPLPDSRGQPTRRDLRETASSAYPRSSPRPPRPFPRRHELQLYIAVRHPARAHIDAAAPGLDQCQSEPPVAKTVGCPVDTTATRHCGDRRCEKVAQAPRLAIRSNLNARWRQCSSRLAIHSEHGRYAREHR